LKAKITDLEGIRTIMPEGEHWFHTDDQVQFLKGLIIRNHM
jgi:hypothetical protein